MAENRFWQSFVPCKRSHFICVFEHNEKIVAAELNSILSDVDVANGNFLVLRRAFVLWRVSKSTAYDAKKSICASLFESCRKRKAHLEAEEKRMRFSPRMSPRTKISPRKCPRTKSPPGRKTFDSAERLFYVFLCVCVVIVCRNMPMDRDVSRPATPRCRHYRPIRILDRTLRRRSRKPNSTPTIATRRSRVP